MRTVAILDAGSSDANRQQKPQRINDQVALAPFDLLARVVSAVTTLRRASRRLRIQYCRCRLRRASLPLPPPGSQAVMHLLKFALLTPAPEGSVHVLPWRKICRQHAPGTPAAHYVAAGIDQQTPAVLRRCATTACVVKQIVHQGPFSIGQAAGVGLFGLLAVMRTCARACPLENPHATVASGRVAEVSLLEMSSCAVRVPCRIRSPSAWVSAGTSIARR